MFATTRCTLCSIISRASILEFLSVSSTSRTTTIGNGRAVSFDEYYGSVPVERNEGERDRMSLSALQLSFRGRAVEGGAFRIAEFNWSAVGALLNIYSAFS